MIQEDKNLNPNKKRYWLRGGLTALLVAVVYLLITSLLSPAPGGGVIGGFLLIPIYGLPIFLVGAIIGGICGKYRSKIKLEIENMKGKKYWLWGGIIGFGIGFLVNYAVIFGVLGAFLAWFYDKIKNRKSFPPKS